jgi:hypothetical protein
MVPTPLALSDSQIAHVMTTARQIPRALRSSYLERIAQLLRAHDDPGDADVWRAATSAAREIMQPRRPPDIAAGDVAAAVFISGAMKGA